MQDYVLKNIAMYESYEKNDFLFWSKIKIFFSLLPYNRWGIWIPNPKIFGIAFKIENIIVVIVYLFPYVHFYFGVPTLKIILKHLSIHYLFLSFPEFSNWPDTQWDCKVSVSPFATATKNLVCSCYLCQFLFWFFPLWFMFSKKTKLEQHLKIC